MRRRKNPADVQQYELLSGDALKGVILFGGVVIAGIVALKLYQKAKSHDVVQQAKVIKIPVMLPQPVKPQST